MAQNNNLREFATKHVEWRIHNFFDLPKTKDFKLESSHFLFKGLKLYFEIVPCSISSFNVTDFSIFLCKYASIKENRVVFNIGIKVSDKIVNQTSDRVIQLGVRAEKYERMNFRNSETGLGQIIWDKSITIFCYIRSLEAHDASTMETSSQTESEETTKNSPQENDLRTVSTTEGKCGISSLIENFKDMYIGKRFTDVTITMKNREFLAHRNVIAARSAVFASMFGHDTVERSTGKVEISDCDPDCFDEFLLFLYTGKFDVVSAKNALDLYKISEKYDVRELKEECLECMSRELSVENFSDVVLLATMYNESALLESATNYFIDNAEAILLTPKWQLFQEKNLVLGNELFLKYIKNKKKLVEKVSHSASFQSTLPFRLDITTTNIAPYQQRQGIQTMKKWYSE